jgi:hypothetical protein
MGNEENKENREWKAWRDDIAEMFRILTVPIVVFCICKVMRWLGMNELFVSILEELDEGGAVLIMAAAVGVSVRRALARVFVRELSK